MPPSALKNISIYLLIWNLVKEYRILAKLPFSVHFWKDLETNLCLLFYERYINIEDLTLRLFRFRLFCISLVLIQIKLLIYVMKQN